MAQFLYPFQKMAQLRPYCCINLAEQGTLEVPIFPVHRSALAFANLVKRSFIGQLLIWFEQVPVCAKQISTFRSANEFNLQSSMFADRLLTEEIEATLAERKI